MNGPLYSRVYRALRAEILSGRLRPGLRVPATRTLAAEIGVSRNIAILAYEQLLAEGYLTSRHGAGTFVASELPEDMTNVGDGKPPPRASDQIAPARLSAYGRRALKESSDRRLRWNSERPPLPYDFRYGRPSFVDFPHTTWCRIVARRARHASVRDLDYGPPEGIPELREAIVEYIHRARAVNCDPDQIVIVNGSQQALDIAGRALIDPGNRVVVEEPHYRGAWAVSRAAGANIASVRVDEHGLKVEELAEKHRRARLVIVTPSHQFPTGVTMPLGRRLELLAWAREVGAFIFEDDYDSEFRYSGRPIEALQALDERGCVIYAATFSKLMFPALRMGYLAVPYALVQPFRALKGLLDTGSPMLPQLALLDFIREGHFERHLRRSRARNASRRAAILEAIAKHIGDRAKVSGGDAGLHVLMWLRDIPPKRVDEIRSEARASGVGVYDASPFYARPPKHAGLVLGYASLTEKEINEGIRRLAGVLRN
ncbi:MAG TPA: PLP-dependent aminotransferase family protein [Candidatus Binataceae bacterium]|nr:PLP-dependent aminotransferase family protein [Candidatus Binataceae bacterium]